MAKTQEELNINKEEIETLNEKLAELNQEDLARCIGGTSFDYKQHLEQFEINNHNRELNDFPKGKTIDVDKSYGKYDAGYQDLPESVVDNQNK